MRRRGLAFLSFVTCGGAGLLVALLLVASPSAIAQTVTGTTTGTTTAPPPTMTGTTTTGTTTGTTTTGTTTTGTTTTGTTTVTTTTATTTVRKPKPVPRPVPRPAPRPRRPTTISAGVTIGGDILVGGLSPAQAARVLRSQFARPLTIRLARRTLLATPRQLGALAHGAEAIRRARHTRPGRNVPLRVTVRSASLDRYLNRLAERFDRSTIDSSLLLRNGKPFVTKHRVGRALDRARLGRALLRSLKTHDRKPLSVTLRRIEPGVSRSSFREIIVIRRSANRLSLFDGMKLRRTFGIATGQAQYPTPLGNFNIIVKWSNPWWYPPQSDWAKDAKPIPPGPGNPLGTRWMGISSPAVGIHGTPDAASIGYSASHGCIRMLIPEVEWLFDQVDIGTPVFIVP
ncbi:MAG: L,D-transpeptidase/peptidoglycan binding protein [Actinomycetota bacterium]|nr:L,D-transpeptidase/peptidoglycan binding protein [Actinomycetota bacterium]